MEDSFGDKDFEEMKHEKKYKLVRVLLYRDVISFFLRKLKKWNFYSISKVSSIFSGKKAGKTKFTSPNQTGLMLEKPFNLYVQTIFTTVRLAREFRVGEEWVCVALDGRK